MAGSASEVGRRRRLDVAGGGSSSALSGRSRDVLAGALGRGSRVVGSAGGIDGVSRLGWESDGDDDRLSARAAGNNNGLGGLGGRSVDRGVVLRADGSGDGDLAGDHDGAGSRAMLDIGSAAGDGDKAGAVDGLGDVRLGDGLGAHDRGVDGSRAAGARGAGADAGAVSIDRSAGAVSINRSTGAGAVNRNAGAGSIDGRINRRGRRRSGRGGAGTVDRRSRVFTVLVAGSSSDNAGESGNGNSGTHFECSC